jgi:hypothetical protein
MTSSSQTRNAATPRTTTSRVQQSSGTGGGRTVARPAGAVGGHHGRPRPGARTSVGFRPGRPPDHRGVPPAAALTGGPEICAVSNSLGLPPSALVVVVRVERRVLQIDTPRPLHPVAGLCWPWTSTPTPSARCRRSRDVVFLDAGRSRYPGWWPEPVRVPRPGGLLAVDDVLSHRDQVADLPRIAADPRLAAAGSRSGRPWCSPSRGPGRQPSSHRRQRAGSRTDHRTARTGRPAAARARCPATCTTMRCRSA